MNLFEISIELESNTDIHISRLLILLNAFSNSDNTSGIQGLTKLAKLDFLLRYPTYLEQALEKKRKSTRNVAIKEYERISVESKMVRYRYGPWDFRYRTFINLLVAHGLAEVSTSGRTIGITLTDKGKQIATQLSDSSDFEDLERRAKLLKTHFDLQGTTLMKFVYETFPEIATLRLGEEIEK